MRISDWSSDVCSSDLATNRFDKTIVFCEDTEHAERMRQALANANADLVAENHRYVMRITGDDALGKAELDNFIDQKARYPVIATTSKQIGRASCRERVCQSV